MKDNWHAQLNPLAAPLPQPIFCVSEPLIAHKKPELHILLYTLRQYAAGYNSSVAAMQMKVCCSSPASICYWFIVSLAAWAVLAAIGGFWQPLHASSAATCLLAMAVGCFANALKSRTYHCMLTGPLFLIAAILLLSSNLTHVKPSLIWTGVVVGTGIAFFLEWRYGRRLSATTSNS